MEQIYHLQLDTTSLLLVPGYIVAVIVGALSGKLANILIQNKRLSQQLF